MVERARITQLPGTHTMQAVVASIAAATSDEVLVWTNNTGATVTIKQAGFVPDTAVTGDDTNNFILQFRNKGTLGTSTTGVTSTKTYATGTDMTAFVDDTLTLSTTSADLDIDDGETVALNKTETGTGLVLPAGVATLTFQYK